MVVVKILGFHCCGTRVQSLVRKLRSCKPHSWGKKKKSVTIFRYRETLVGFSPSKTESLEGCCHAGVSSRNTLQISTNVF